MGDGQRLRHRQAAGHDRHPRRRCPARRRACGSRCASRSQYRDDGRDLGRRRRRRLGLARVGTARGTPRRVRLELHVRAAAQAGARCAASCSFQLAPRATRSARRPRSPPRRATAPARARTRRATPPRLRARRAEAEQPRVVGDDAGDAERSSRRDRAAVVDGPHVELAARLAHGAHQARGDEPPVGHQRVAAARARMCGARPRAGSCARSHAAPRRPGAWSASDCVGVAPQTRDRPAEAQPRLQRAQDDRATAHRTSRRSACARPGRAPAARRRRAPRSRGA